MDGRSIIMHSSLNKIDFKLPERSSFGLGLGIVAYRTRKCSKSVGPLEISLPLRYHWTMDSKDPMTRLK